MKDYIKRAILRILGAGSVNIADVDGGQDPYLYSSGWFGPGYVMIKGLVGRPDILIPLIADLAREIAKACPNIQFVAGNVSGGVVPAWELRHHLEALLGRPIQYVYVRETRKKGGKKEHITGLEHLRPGMIGIVLEELVNFAGTTVNSVLLLREAGLVVDHAGCLLFYDNPEANKALRENGITMNHLFTLEEVLQVAEETHHFRSDVIADYRHYLADPIGWNKRRGYEQLVTGGTK